MRGETSRLLIDESPLLVLPGLACLIGDRPAIALQQLHFRLVNTNAQGERTAHLREDRYWVYNTYPEWRRTNFPFWSVSTIRRVFDFLEDEKIVLSKEFNASAGDRTKWYTIDYERFDEYTRTLNERLKKRVNKAGGSYRRPGQPLPEDDGEASTPSAQNEQMGLPKLSSSLNTETTLTESHTPPASPPVCETLTQDEEASNVVVAFPVPAGLEADAGRDFQRAAHLSKPPRLPRDCPKEYQDEGIRMLKTRIVTVPQERVERNRLARLWADCWTLGHIFEVYDFLSHPKAMGKRPRNERITLGSVYEEIGSYFYKRRLAEQQLEEQKSNEQGRSTYEPSAKGVRLSRDEATLRNRDAQTIDQTFRRAIVKGRGEQ